MKILDKAQILTYYDAERAVVAIRDSFIAYSTGRAVSPPVQHFVFPDDDGDGCVKSAYLAGDDFFAVKVSTGFYNNAARGLSSNQGLTMVFCAHTGRPLALLQDEGWLTCLRTALAGRLVAEVLAPPHIDAIGIVGTGMQARLQLAALEAVTPCREIWLWGAHDASLYRMADELSGKGYHVHPTRDAKPLAFNSQLIVTCTPSRAPILQADWIQAGTHITAVGADAEGKQELATALPASVDRVVVDAVAQCAAYGEVSHAVRAGLLAESDLTELGQILTSARPGRIHADETTLADLTGLAVQDVAIAKSILAINNSTLSG